MAGDTPTDPRLEPDSERDLRPSVTVPRAGISPLAIGIVAVVVALLLFGVLDARRRALSAPAVVSREPDTAGGSEPPPLYIPPPPPPAPTPLPVPPAPVPIAPSLPIQPAVQTPRVVFAAPAAPAPAVVQTPPAAPPRVSGGAALVVDNSSGRANGAANAAASGEGGAQGTSTGGSAPRAQAGMFANRSTTVPQGTLIAAVLETAFDSTRPGFARALVQRDIRGFDGTQVLIPRGSRLIGEYRSATAPGQKRAMVAWSRLIRPDGVSIAIGSPAADPVGRGGIKADVNNHFFERFAGAILQSALDVGVNLASRSSNSPTIVALPGSFGGNTAQLVHPAQIPPTLSVKAGTSVSVFVARDLDFTDVQGRR